LHAKISKLGKRYQNADPGINEKDLKSKGTFLLTSNGEISPIEHVLGGEEEGLRVNSIRHVWNLQHK